MVLAKAETDNEKHANQLATTTSPSIETEAGGVDRVHPTTTIMWLFLLYGFGRVWIYRTTGVQELADSTLYN